MGPVVMPAKLKVKVPPVGLPVKLITCTVAPLL